jgi:Transglycosylase SLT domain
VVPTPEESEGSVAAILVAVVSGQEGEPMTRNEQAGEVAEVAEFRLHSRGEQNPREPSDPRLIVIRSGSAWMSAAFLCLCLLLLGLVLLGHHILRGIDRESQQAATSMAGLERKVQQLESERTFESKRRYLLLGMRDHILKVNPRVSLADAYLYARLAIEAGEKFPSVDPVLLLSIGTVESGFDPQATSHSDARGLYQIWPSTGRLLLRSLGWSYDDAALYDPEKNTQAAALYLDVLFATYNDPQLVLAEYNGGPLNAGYFRAHVGALADETRTYVPRVLELYGRLKDEFAKGMDFRAELIHRDTQREGKTLGPVGPATRRASDH